MVFLEEKSHQTLMEHHERLAENLKGKSDSKHVLSVLDHDSKVLFSNTPKYSVLIWNVTQSPSQSEHWR